jgi:hypothetical protein
MKEIVHRQNSGQFFAMFSLLCCQMSLLIIAGELWWIKQE